MSENGKLVAKEFTKNPRKKDIQKMIFRMDFMSPSIGKSELFAILHLTWHLDRKEVKCFLKCFCCLSDECETEVSQIFVFFLEDFWCVDVETIELYCETIGIESEVVRFIGFCHCVYSRLKSSEHLDEGFIIG